VKAIYRKTVILDALNKDSGSFPAGVVALSGPTEINVGVDIPEIWCFSVMGTWVGTISFYTSADNINFFPLGVTSVAASGPDYISSTNSNGLFKGSPLIQGHGCVVCKCIMTAYTSGVANVTVVEMHGTGED
jgi:hypothetical protein